MDALVEAARKNNWRDVLGISASESDATVVRKRYRKLCLQFHPDKNREGNAEDVFKLIVQAFGLVMKELEGKQEMCGCPGDDRFWTKCNSCNYMFEYYTFCLGQLLRCKECKALFYGERCSDSEVAQRKAATTSTAKRPYKRKAPSAKPRSTGKKTKRQS